MRDSRTEGKVVRGLRREGPTFQPCPDPLPGGPRNQTYRRAPFNADLHSLRVGFEVVARYDPEDPRRVVVERTQQTFPPGTYVVNGGAALSVRVGLAVWVLI